MKKLSTHIKGLDSLFLGGIQVMSVTHDKKRPISWDRDSLVIVIRGCRGANKHLFAMQLMHGLVMSISNFKKTYGKRVPSYHDATLRYYSINKPTHLLEDMYLDLLIERWISHTNIEFKQVELAGKTNLPQYTALCNRTMATLQFLFDTDGKERSLPLHKTPERVISEYLVNNIIGYNARTNSIHLRHSSPNDDDTNLLFKRKHDAIGEYFVKDMDAFDGIKKEQEDTYYDFKSEFLKTDFNPHLKADITSENSAEYIPVRNADSARTNFFSILNNIEEALDHKAEKDSKDETADNPENKNDADYRFPYEAVVIEGFSHISEKDLCSLPYTHLVNSLRRLSRISILVFEDTQTTMPDGDIEIEIRSNYNEDENYTYNELRVSKCVNHITAAGWHIYKRRESEIIIYPSIHLRLFKRSYINDQLSDLGRSVIENSYSMYLDSLRREALLNNVSEYGVIYDNLQNYVQDGIENSAALFNYMIGKAMTQSENVSDDKARDALESILLGKWKTEFLPRRGDDCRVEPYFKGVGLHDHCPTTAIVGNPNSHKRTLALSRVFRCAKDGDQVLILLLDKDPEEMRKKVLCPAMACKLAKTNNGKCECLQCYKRISFLSINPGCITPEEFFSMLLDHIRVYTGEYNRPDEPRRRLHIVIDDYHRIDFCFPFLSTSSLFTTALISLCQTHNTGLTILCDKSSKRVREVCTLSDNVLCVEREENQEPHRLTVYAERMGDAPHTSAIVKYDIENIVGLMQCDHGTLSLSCNVELHPKEVCSMKEYWRQTYNVINHSPQEKNMAD